MLPRAKRGVLRRSDAGFAALFFAILTLAVIFAIGLSVAVLTFGQQIISGNITKSTQAYFSDEAGIEDALLRLAKGKSWSSTYTLAVENVSTNVAISDVIGGSRTITSRGDSLSRIRKSQVVYQISIAEASFFFGAQAGDGGMDMKNNAIIHGNVFSNGDIMGDNNSLVDNSVVVSGHHQINKGKIGGDVLVYDCVGADITGQLTYVNSNSCTADGGIQQQADEIDPVPLPITQSQIDDWKVEAANGDVIENDVAISGTQSLGAVQIGTPADPKSLTVDGTLNMTGTIYVTGDATFNGTTHLDSDYGSYSGVIIADGKINVENGATLTGSGQIGSYILVLSTNNSLDPLSPAIYVKNHGAASIFYTTSGLLYLKNEMDAREITGYKIQIDPNAEIFYESGLSDLHFSGGPGGGWVVTSWKEIE